MRGGTIAPGGRAIVTAQSLETATGADVWSGPAILTIDNSGTFELMTRLTSPSGLVSNTNCVRRGNAHNIEGFDSEDMTFVRIINTGNSLISAVTGTLYDTNGLVLGNANTTLLDSLRSKEAVWLNRDDLGAVLDGYLDA